MFSTPVRGSVDAGQPDSIDTRSSIRNLMAQEKQNARVAYQIDYMTGGKVNSIQSNALEKGITDHKRSQKRPNINVTTNPLDISLIGATQPCNTQGCNAQSSASTKSRGRSAGESLDIISSCSLRKYHDGTHVSIVSLIKNATSRFAETTTTTMNHVATLLSVIKTEIRIFAPSTFLLPRISRVARVFLSFSHSLSVSLSLFLIPVSLP